MLEKIFRLLKRLDAWVLDLLYPELDDDDPFKDYHGFL